MTRALSVATETAAALLCGSTLAPKRQTIPDGCFCFARQSEAGQRHAREADAEFLQRSAPRDRLGHALGEFIELVVHVFSFRFVGLGLTHQAIHVAAGRDLTKNLKNILSV